MLLDRNKHIESAHIGEELFSDPEKERLHTCMIVEQTIADGDFSFEEALEAYKVPKEEYESFIAKKSNENISISISGPTSGRTSSSYFSVYFDVVAKMLDTSIMVSSVYKKRLSQIQQELVHLSKEMEAHNKSA